MKRHWFTFFFGSGIVAFALTCPASETEPKPPGDDAISFAVPEGSPGELVEFTKDLQKQVHREVQRLQRKLKQTSAEAADKILAGNPSDEEAEFALNLKIRSLPSPAAWQSLVEKFENAGQKQFARMVKGHILQYELSMAARRSPAKLRKTLKTALAFLAEETPRTRDLRLAQGVGVNTERHLGKDAAVETYRKLGELFSKSPDKEARDFAKKMEGVVRRITLLGKEIELQGNLLDGQPLDMAKYKNKVVLIDFWATWCGPCVGEIPNLKKNYDRYHDRGFEIISLSLDKKKADVEQFVEQRKIPWANVYGTDGPSPSVEYYGVMLIPTMILVDRDGKVVSIAARGQELDRLLKKYLGSVDEKESPKNN
ncbi:MAG: TlpA family protein disulfide reductase [Pirellulales bacterium]|nr:TlpA family protein disulfide reductase [Pirellulales bacterium]